MENFEGRHSPQELHRFVRRVVYSVVWVLVEHVQDRHQHSLSQLLVALLRKKIGLAPTLHSLRGLNQLLISQTKVTVHRRRHHVQLDSRDNPALQTVTVDDMGHSMHYNSSTPLFGSFLVPVL